MGRWWGCGDGTSSRFAWEDRRKSLVWLIWPPYAGVIGCWTMSIFSGPNQWCTFLEMGSPSRYILEWSSVPFLSILSWVVINLEVDISILLYQYLKLDRLGHLARMELPLPKNFLVYLSGQPREKSYYCGVPTVELKFKAITSQVFISSNSILRSNRMPSRKYRPPYVENFIKQ